MTSDLKLRLGISKINPCGYIETRTEQLIVIAEENTVCAEAYPSLLTLGFRRCGNSLYRPQCPACNACRPIRIHSHKFQASRSQRRLLGKSGDLEVRWVETPSTDYFPLYQRYIDLRHGNGSMAPATRVQYQGFIQSEWASLIFMEIWDAEQLICVAATDRAQTALSAVYTFFEPEYDRFSLGTLAILNQLSFARDKGFEYLYLGFQIDECVGMNYKRNFKPYQLLTPLGWQNFGS